MQSKGSRILKSVNRYVVYPLLTTFILGAVSACSSSSTPSMKQTATSMKTGKEVSNSQVKAAMDKLPSMYDPNDPHSTPIGVEHPHNFVLNGKRVRLVLGPVADSPDGHTRCFSGIAEVMPEEQEFMDFLKDEAYHLRVCGSLPNPSSGSLGRGPV